MDAIVNFFSTIGEIISSLFDTMIIFYQLVVEAIQSVVVLFTYVPTYVAACVVGVYVIGLIKMLISLGGSNA